MKETPNKDAPQMDVEFIIEELFNLFNEADDGSLEPVMTLSSHLGSTFHARVLNAAAHLGIATGQAECECTRLRFNQLTRYWWCDVHGEVLREKPVTPAAGQGAKVRSGAHPDERS